MRLHLLAVATIAIAGVSAKPQYGSNADQVQEQFCCCLLEGQDCPVADIGEREDDIFGSEEYCAAKGDGTAPLKCCYPSKFHYESIGDGNIETIQSTCPAVDSYNSQQGAASAPQVDPNSCDAHRSEGYECVPFYQCEDGEIIDDGAGLLDIRNGFLDPESSACPNYLEECCRLPDFYEPVTAAPRPINCEWSDYSWGECDKSCGGGTQTGERHYSQLAENGGQECTGETTTTQSCNEQECPAKIDCAWSAYSWGECDKTCGGGYQYGTRTVARYADGGKECEGEAASTRSCNTDPCPVNCEWSDFEWGPCSKSCGGGEMTGTRTERVYQAYGGEPCYGTTTRTSKCNIADCPTSEPLQRKCGERNLNGISTRIQSDPETSSTQFGEWPNMCALLRDISIAGQTYKGFVCGASLIAPNFVLTAAHCVEKYANEHLTVRCGDWDTTSEKIEPLEHQERPVVRRIIHPLFNNKSLHEDFAVLHLEREFDLQSHIGPACLWDGDKTVIDKSGCVATGWGKDRWGNKGRHQTVLKQVEFDLVSNADCQEAMRTRTDLGKRFRLHDSFICAGGQKGVDTCRGDGGSPLMCPLASNPDYYVQTGIVAWGKECGKEGVPGVYASVQKAECFIKWSMSCGDEFYKLPEYCQGFLDPTLKKLEDEREKYQASLDNAPEGALRSIDRVRLENKLSKANWSIDRITQTLRDCPAQGSQPVSNPTNPYPRGPGNPDLTTDDDSNDYSELSGFSASPQESTDGRG